MSPISFASIGASLLGLILSIWLFISSSAAQGLQADLQTQQQSLQSQQLMVQTQQQRLQQQQEQIQSGNVLSQQVGPQVLQDLARRAVTNKNDKIRSLLAKHDLNIQEKPAAGATPAGTPAATPALR